MPVLDPPARRLISMRETYERLGCSRTTIYKQIDTDPTFPRPLKVGNRTVFAEHLLNEWIDAQIARSRGEVAAGGPPDPTGTAQPAAAPAAS